MLWAMIGVILVTTALSVSGQPKYPTGLTSHEVGLINNRAKAGKCGAVVKIDSVYDKHYFKIMTNGMPDHSWGCVNRNTPEPVDVMYTLPKNHTFMGKPYCLPKGAIGMALNGVAFFHPLTANGQNAVYGFTREEFDCCDAHPTPQMRMHYHKLPTSKKCDNPIWDVNDRRVPQFLGFALDGFPIYSEWEGLDPDNDLDMCHGMTLPDNVGLGHSEAGRYAYIAVQDHFPYIMGCFRGEPVALEEESADCKKIRCANMRNTNGLLCDCDYGVVSYKDVTCTESHLSQNKKNKIQKKNQQDPSGWIDYIYEKVFASKSRQKRSIAKAISPKFDALWKKMAREESESCYKSSCSRKGDQFAELINGQCIQSLRGCAPPDCPIPERNGVGCGKAPPPGGDGRPPPPGGDGRPPPPGGDRRPPPPGGDGRPPPPGGDGRPPPEEDNDEDCYYATLDVED